jgi:cytochrome P450
VNETKPESRVGADFDHRDRESAYSPWDRWAQLRAQGCPVHSDKYGGFHVAARYSDVFEIARNPEVFSSHLRQTTIPQLVTPPFPPINYDPPDNVLYRMIVNPFLTPQKVREHEPWIREMAAGYIDKVLAADAFDFPKEVGVPLTRDIILRILGIVAAPVEVNLWADDLIFLNNPEEAAKNLMGFLAQEVAKRRVNPGADVISGLVQAKFGDRPLDDSEILRMTLLLLLAGLDTTNFAMSGSIWYLIRNPQARKELAAADAMTWRLAMEEFVRWVSPAPAQARTARVDTSVSGCPMRAGEMVMLLFGAANRDETEFPNPDAVVFDRRPNRHMGFGIGPHRCLGSHLAKLEMQVVLERLLPGLENFQLADPSAVVWEGASVRGIRSLPLVRKTVTSAGAQGSGQ